MELIERQKIKIAVIGLGYVGLPLAVEYGKYFKTIGYDINQQRVFELSKGIDNTLELSNDEINESKNLEFSHKPNSLNDTNVYIVTVPTPIDKNKIPDLTPLIEASKLITKYILPGDTVVFESTVYPGVTEEICVPILEESGLILNNDFWVGYSPERINPGDKDHGLTTIQKVTSGSNNEASEFIDKIYKVIIPAGTFKAESIKVAEAAKVIENTQRDLNIALINELAMLFNKLDINTQAVLEAAETKWNFLPFKPGLVGGHCIGVDPYYLTHKAQSIGYNPEVILAGRRINDGMGSYIANKIIEALHVRNKDLKNTKILVLGLTFKENCPDIRNTKVIDIIEGLKSEGIAVHVQDPWADKSEVLDKLNLHLLDEYKDRDYDAVIVAVAHNLYKQITVDQLLELLTSDGFIYDLKHILPLDQRILRL
jgi:UDP-N-acetyl-D-galactosamine dehydrogenase